MESYRKSTDYVEVYILTAQNVSAIVEVLDKSKAQYELLETAIPFGLDKTYYKISITIQQDGNVLVLTPGKYLVKDNLNHFSVYSENYFKRLFDRVRGPSGEFL